jgi:hypothetical protein
MEDSARTAATSWRLFAGELSCQEGNRQKSVWSVTPWSNTVMGQLAAQLERAGDRKRADALLQTLGTGEAYGASTGLAIFHSMRGDAEESAEWAARGIAQRFLPLVYMVAPLLKSHSLG